MDTDVSQANKLANKLKKQQNLSNQEIRNGVNQVIENYRPLITSKEAAVIFYAQKHHNTQLVQKEPEDLKIKNIVPEINNIELTCQVKKIDKFTYTKKGETRKGCDITLTDNTGSISMMVWGDSVEEIDESLEGETVEITGSYSSEYQGEVQLNYSEDTEIKEKES